MTEIEEHTADDTAIKITGQTIPVAFADNTSPFNDAFMCALKPHSESNGNGNDKPKATRNENIQAMGSGPTSCTQAEQTDSETKKRNAAIVEAMSVFDRSKADQDTGGEEIDPTPSLTIQFLDDRSKNEQYGYESVVRPYLASADYWDEDLNEAEENKLSEEDRQEFEEMDEKLAELWKSVIDAGFHLAYIKRFGLYREKYPTFAAYCEARLGMKHIPHRG